MNLRYKWHLSYSNIVISRYKCMSVLWLSYLRYERDFIVPIYQEKTTWQKERFKYIFKNTQLTNRRKQIFTTFHYNSLIIKIQVRERGIDNQ